MPDRLGRFTSGIPLPVFTCDSGRGSTPAPRAQQALHELLPLLISVGREGLKVLLKQVSLAGRWAGMSGEPEVGGCRSEAGWKSRPHLYLPGSAVAPQALARQHPRAAVHGGELLGGPPRLPPPRTRALHLPAGTAPCDPKLKHGCTSPGGLRQLPASFRFASCVARSLRAVISQGSAAPSKAAGLAVQWEGREARLCSAPGF